MKTNSRPYRLLATTICIVGIILDYEWHFCILRLVDNGLMMLLLSLFLWLDVDFGSANSDADDTSLLWIFWALGVAAYAVELVTYPILQSRRLNIIKKTLSGREFFRLLLLNLQVRKLFQL